MKKRDFFAGKWGFILACIDSAVGVGNIWLFPRRVAEFGAPFLLAYIICVIAIGFTGVVGEMTFGRSMRGGPVAAFSAAVEQSGRNPLIGKCFALIPVLGTFAMAIGYSVIAGWVFKYFMSALTGSVFMGDNVEAYLAAFDMMASGHSILPWHILALLIVFIVVLLGVSGGIEKANKIFMPLFFVMFVGIAIYVSTLTGAKDGYIKMFVISDWSALADGRMWKYALGQAFFSLSVAGAGTLVYGSYLSDKEDIPACAMTVALFDTLAAFVASLAIIPAMCTVYNATGAAANEVAYGGPGLLFAYLPLIFRNVPGGGIVMVFFFAAVLFAAVTSLINMLEVPIEALQTALGFARNKAVFLVSAVCTVIAVCIESIVSGWMDICSIYICPIGALIAAIFFFWFCKRDFIVSNVDLGSRDRFGKFIATAGKFVFVPITFLVLLLGSLTSGGIG
ncbi:MAG: sodium-dependent transporter [Oscillospiraceae bacterium]|nr:sodium-dependent transporter [Oscillospiraceae bacterium]